MPSDTTDTRLQQFVAAQDAVYQDVLEELAAGKKRSHWIWFVFPQLRGLGRSTMSHNFGIMSLDEARRYLAHNVLGPRLRECTQLVLKATAKDITSILGYPDDVKFRSCMTLFAAAAPDEPLFEAALARYFNGHKDQATLKLLAAERSGPSGAVPAGETH
jgi:uncharacterized protein (DUF1810 family)